MPSLSTSSFTRNWEWKLCAGLLLILLATIGFMVAGLLREVEPAPSSTQAAPNPPSLFGGQAFAFLYPPPQPGAERNPFRFRRSYPKPQSQQGGGGSGNASTTVGGGSGGSGGSTSRPSPPPPPKPRRSLLFSGWIEAPGGERVAFLVITDPRTNAVLHRGPVRSGDTVAGFTVLAMDASTLRLRDSGGNEQALTLRESRTVELP
jgi:hypothetical protein